MYSDILHGNYWALRPCSAEISQKERVKFPQYSTTLLFFGGSLLRISANFAKVKNILREISKVIVDFKFLEARRLCSFFVHELDAELADIGSRSWLMVPRFSMTLSSSWVAFRSM